MVFVSLVLFYMYGEKKKRKTTQGKTANWCNFESCKSKTQLGNLLLLSKNSEKLTNTGKIDYANSSDSS